MCDLYYFGPESNLFYTCDLYYFGPEGDIYTPSSEKDDNTFSIIINKVWISISNYMFKREICDKFTEFTFLKFWFQNFKKWTR